MDNDYVGDCISCFFLFCSWVNHSMISDRPYLDVIYIYCINAGQELKLKSLYPERDKFGLPSRYRWLLFGLCHSDSLLTCGGSDHGPCDITESMVRWEFLILIILCVEPDVTLNMPIRDAWTQIGSPFGTVFQANVAQTEQNKNDNIGKWSTYLFFINLVCCWTCCNSVLTYLFSLSWLKCQILYLSWYYTSMLQMKTNKLNKQKTKQNTKHLNFYEIGLL